MSEHHTGRTCATGKDLCETKERNQINAKLPQICAVHQSVLILWLMPRQAAAVAQAPRPPCAPLTVSSSPEGCHRAATRSGLSTLIEPAKLLLLSNTFDARKKCHARKKYELHSSQCYLSTKAFLVTPHCSAAFFSTMKNHDFVSRNLEDLRPFRRRLHSRYATKL